MPYSSADVNAFLGVGMQTGLAAPNTTLAKLRYAKYLSGTNVDPVAEVVFLREGGDGHEWGFGYKSSYKVQGQIVANARPEILGQLLQLAPAAATWDGGSAPAQHTFSNQGASYPYSTMYVEHPGSALVHMLSDVRVGGITIEGESGAPWKVTLPFTAITYGGSLTSTLAVPSYAAEDPFMFTLGSYQIDGGLATAFTSFKLDIAFNMEELQAANVLLDDIVVQNKDTTIEYVQRFEDPTLWKKINLGAGIVPTTSVPTGTLRINTAYGAAGTLKSFDINLPLIGYNDSTLTELDPDGKSIMVTTTGKPLKGATTSAILTLKNVHASAYAP